MADQAGRGGAAKSWGIFCAVFTTPGGIAASLGLALCLCSLEAWRFPVLAEIAHHSSAASQLSALLGLVAVGLYYRFGKGVWLNSQLGVIVVALITSMSLYVSFATESAGDYLSILDVLKCSSFAFGFILLCIWASNLFGKGRAFSISVFVAAILVTFVVQTCIGMLLTVYARGVCIALPLLSALLLILFQRANSLSALSLRPGEHAERGANAFFTSKRKLQYALLLAVFACYGLLFKTLHFRWLPYQDAEWSPFAIQMVSALGALIAGVALLALLGMLVSMDGTSLCGCLMLVLTLLALWFSTMSASQGTPELFYLATLNAAQKTLYLFAFYVCLPIPGRRNQLLMLVLLLFLYRLGSSSDLFVALLPQTAALAPFETPAVVVASLIIVAQLFWSLFEPFAQRQELAADAPAAPVDESAYRSAAFYFYLCQRYNLTLREVDVLKLLERHEGAAAIASILTISPATAKTHMRNIYTKLDVHSQNELNQFLDAERSSFRLE